MTGDDRLFWLRVHRRAQQMEPDVRRAFLDALRIIRDALSDADIARLASTGDFELLFREVFSDALFQRATIAYRIRLRRIVERAFQYTVADLPSGGQVDGILSVMFDHLNPAVLDAIRTMETRVLTQLAADVRAVVRAVVSQGLADGLAPRTIARGLRGVIGLGPTQVQEVENYRDALNGLNGRSVTDYTLRDRRLNPRTPEQIDKAVEAYRKRRIAQNAETTARTATLDAFKQGQRLAWEDAIRQGVVDRGRLRHMWIGVMDARERPTHVAMEHEVQPFDQPYSNGELVPGESTYNCRCLDRFFVASA